MSQTKAAGGFGMQKNIGLATMLALVLLVSPGCGSTSGSNGGAHDDSGEAEESAADAIAVQVAPLVRQPVSSLYSTSATLRADKRAMVTARTHGVIRRLLVEEGDRVREGQPLAHLEDDEQRIELERASTTHSTKRREYERAEQLHGQGLLSEEEYETTRREHEEAKQAAALAELSLSRTVMRAPFDGTILERHLDVGATVSDGTAVYDLADLDPLYADVNVPERHVARLLPGQSVRLTADATGQQVPAGIERIAPAVDPSTGTVKVTLAVNSASRLRPGAFARIDIVTDTHPDALVAPRSALVAEGRRWHLFLLDEGANTVRQLEVLPGFEEQDRVEILELPGGEQELKPEQLVVVVGAAALTDGATVQVVDESTDEPSEVQPVASGA